MKKQFLSIATGILFSVSAFAQNTIPIPDTLVGTNISLTMHTDSLQILPGKKTKTLAFNAYNFLGPTLILNKWQTANISVSNQIGDTTTVHWHGLHIPSKYDGGPHTLIMNGTTWNPSFSILNNAAMYWYHPHFMGKTAEQAIKGASGLIIVRDSAERNLILPRIYGVDDIPLIVKCLQLDNNNQFLPKGMQDSTLLVNGVTNAQYSLPAQVVRLRLLNGSGERTFNFGFTANKQFYVIGNDGGLLNGPVPTTRIRLSPGERAEVLLNLSGMNGQTIYLMSYGSELPMGVQGGPTMSMGSGPPMNSPLNGIDFNILKLNITAQTSNPVTTIPSSLVSVAPYLTSQSNVTRNIKFTAPSMMTMDGPFFFNDSTFDMMRIDYQIPLNNVEIWSLTNQTMVAHPFHLHLEQFFIIDRNGIVPAAVEKGWKDVVLVEPNETVRLITKFRDFVDSVVPYMYHCHVLMHEDDGMMGQFVVMPQGWAGIKNIPGEISNASVYPNPSTGNITIDLNGFDDSKPVQLNVRDALGKNVYSEVISRKEFTLNTSEWGKGLYIISFLQGEKLTHKKFIIK
jgi:blue copper oxidase